MLTTVAVLQTIPLLKKQPADFLTTLLGMADRCVKDYLDQEVEEAAYTEFYSGARQPDLILKQRPVSAVTSVYLDPNGNWGQTSGAFASGTLLTAGVNYALQLDAGGTVSHRGLLRRLGGADVSFPGWYRDSPYTGRLSATRLPTWTPGNGNVKVTYTAGYASGSVPQSIVGAVIEVIAWMVRNLPVGGILQGEGLGAYNYSLFFPPLGSIPELGSARQMLSRYREWTFGAA